MFESQEREWPYIPKPSAIENLIAQRQIGEMTADEYRVLARQAQIMIDAQSGNFARRRPR